MKISAIRDVLGRVRSVNTRFGHPMNNNGQQMDDELHENRWRGYTYAKRGFLKRAWEKDENAYSPVDTHTLIPNAITNADLNDVGNNNNAQPWDRLRDSAVGSLNQIVNNNSGEVRWQTVPRAQGHRLVAIEVDGENYPVVHDEMGRVRRTLDFVLEYDASNRLTEAHNTSTGEFEFYAYDAQGRLAFVYSESQVHGKTTQHFGYDGARMVVAMDKNYSILWQSFQGPSLDLILEFHDANQAVIPLIDHRKSIAGAWDMTNGFMVGIATYDAEGRVAQYSNDEALECNEVGNPSVNCAAPAGMPFGLNARWRSPLTGFANMHHRWYSPRMGEFLSHDPLGYVDSYNLFGFATFDPINGYDPFGLSNQSFAYLRFGDVINDEESLNQLEALEADIRKTGRSRLRAPPVLQHAQIRAEAYLRNRKKGNYFKAFANLALALMDSFAYSLYDEKSPTQTVKNIGGAIAVGAVLSALNVASTTSRKGLAARTPRVPLRFNPNIRNHLTSIDGFTQRKGVIGAHTTEAFGKAVSDFGLKITKFEEHPTVKGIYRVSYRLPAKDRAGNFTGKFKGNGASPFRKTVYDTKVISTEKIILLGREAAQNATSRSGKVNSSGFRIFFKDGAVTNFFPNFKNDT